MIRLTAGVRPGTEAWAPPTVSPPMKGYMVDSTNHARILGTKYTLSTMRPLAAIRSLPRLDNSPTSTRSISTPSCRNRGSRTLMRLPEWSRSSTRITGRRKERMVRIWLDRGVYPGKASMPKDRRSWAKTLSVWRVLVTVLGMALPRRILPKGTHILGPSTRGLVGSAGTPLRSTILRTNRW